MAKMKRQIRRTPRDLAIYRVGGKMAVDFHDFPEDKDGYSRVLLITDRISQMMWDYYLDDRRSDSIVTAQKHLQILERQYGIRVKAMECDNEIYQRRKTVRNTSRTWGSSWSLQPPTRSLRTERQNARGVCSGRKSTQRGRAQTSRKHCGWR
ncbi:hypothetical protein VTN31DRAFT_6647 [Thermomyces dupontii]|uniref:uncharacterized protein n=1 Tax=Talaromyces thermophilus TaxID=28565 RepID=UPI0037436CA7